MCLDVCPAVGHASRPWAATPRRAAQREAEHQEDDGEAGWPPTVVRPHSPETLPADVHASVATLVGLRGCTSATCHASRVMCAKPGR